MLPLEQAPLERQGQRFLTAVVGFVLQASSLQITVAPLPTIRVSVGSVYELPRLS